MEHGMNVARQIRKANGMILEISQSSMEDKHERVLYLRNLKDKMWKDADNGRPEPWSYYLPRYWEEFGD